MSAKKQTRHFLDSFLPNSILADRHLAPAVRIRARAMVGVLMLSVILPFVVLMAFVILQIASGLNFTTAIVSNLIVLFVLISQHMIFQSYGNLRVTTLAYDIQFFLTIVIGIFVSGGWHSPVMILLPCSPMITFMTVGYRASVVNIAIVFVITLAFYILQVKGFILPNTMPEETRDYVSLMMWFMFFCIMVLLLDTSEALLNKK